MCQSSTSGQPSRRWKNSFHVFFLFGNKKISKEVIARHAKVKNVTPQNRKILFYLFILFFIVMGSTPRDWGICKFHIYESEEK